MGMGMGIIDKDGPVPPHLQQPGPALLLPLIRMGLSGAG